MRWWVQWPPQFRRPPKTPKTSSKPRASLEPDAPFDCTVDPKGVPVSMLSSLDWESVTTPGAILEWETRVGLQVSGGNYYGSCSSCEPMISQFEGAADIENSRE